MSIFIVFYIVSNYFNLDKNVTEIMGQQNLEGIDINENTVKVHVLADMDDKISILLPEKCHFVGEMWCEIDEFECNGKKCKETQSQSCHHGGAISEHIKRHSEKQ